MLAPTAIAASAAKAPKNNAYIVQLAEQPVAAYTGGIAGYAATKPRKGQKINPNDPQVSRYMGYLATRQDSLLGAAGGGKKLYNYGYVFNGFAAELSEAQAQKLAQMPGVLAVTKDEIRKLDTASTPAFLGLTGNSGFWATKAKGENVVIGIVDSGIWPEHPSFSDRTGSNGNGTQDGKLDYQQIPGWNGKCTPGEAFTASDCNQKLIGAQFFNAGFGGNAGIKEAVPVRIQLAARRRRPRLAHRVHRRRQRQRGGHRPGRGVRQHQRHRAAGPHLGLQGLLGQQRRGRLRRRRQRRSDRPGRRRWRGRHQLLDQRHQHQLPRPGRDRLPVRG